MLIAAYIALLLICCQPPLLRLFCKDNLMASPESESAEDIRPKFAAGGQSPVAIVRNRLDYPEITDEMQQLLLRFMSSGFRSLMRLQQQDAAGYFHTDTNTGAESFYWAQTLLSLPIEIRRLQPTDLTMRSCTYGITYTDFEVLADGGIRIDMAEDSAAEFAFIPHTLSYESGKTRRFILRRVGTRYLIDGYEEHGDDIQHLLREVYTDQCERMELPEHPLPQQIKAALHAAKQRIVADALSNINRAKQSPAGEQTVPAYFSHPYNRGEAIRYAMEWVDQRRVIRNPLWSRYDDYGGNCNNFISQCIFAGGVPMDFTGNAAVQWKWYDESINPLPASKGRSPSWSGVDAFYRYCLGNDGVGLVASVDQALDKGEPGDIFQLGALDNWRHSVMITQVVVDDDGVVDYLVSSNTTDRINYPVTAHIYTDTRLIKIYGWNE